MNFLLFRKRFGWYAGTLNPSGIDAWTRDKALAESCSAERIEQLATRYGATSVRIEVVPEGVEA